MEQIGVISEFKVRSDGHILVDFAPFSWLRDDIYYYAVPRIRQGNKEILLSLVDPQEWHHTWEIMFNIVRDRSGIIFELTQLLAEKAINIVKQEGLTPSEELQYSFWVLVKLTDYVEREHLSGKTKEEIGAYLKADLNSSLKHRNIQEIEAIGVNEIELLYENHHTKVTKNLNSITATRLTPFFQTRIGFWVINNRCAIPTDRLFPALEFNAAGHKRIHGTIFSDFSQKNFFIIRLFEQNQKVVFLDIRHKHVVGAIKELSEVIYKESGQKYNILYNRVTIKKDPGEYSSGIENASHWYVLMELEGNVEKINTVFRHLESVNHLTFGEGKSIRILDYTDNLRPLLKGHYRKKEYRKPTGVNLLRLTTFFIAAISIFSWTIICLLHHEEIVKIIQKSAIGSAILIIVALIIARKELKDGILDLLPERLKG